MYPKRIVCLAGEAPDILHRLGVLDRVVGLSVHTKQPDEALHLPRVSGFKFGSMERILEQSPDLAILTSYVQSEMAASLIAAGVPVIHVSPHRLDDIFDLIMLLGNVVGQPTRAQELCEEMRIQVERIGELGNRLPYHPKVFFEHTANPISCPPAWVSDIIETSGGSDVFRDVAIRGRLAVDRVIQPEDVEKASPDLFLCHNVQSLERHKQRWNQLFPTVSAIQNDHTHQVQSSIFYFGPTTLMDSLNEIHEVIRQHFC